MNTHNVDIGLGLIEVDYGNNFLQQSYRGSHTKTMFNNDKPRIPPISGGHAEVSATQLFAEIDARAAFHQA